MITNIRLDTSDKERNLIAMYLERDAKTTRMVSRKELTELVQQLINDIVTQADDNEYDEPEVESSPKMGAAPKIAEFKPSRGDEPYLYKPKSVTLKDACSRMLDMAEEVEQLVWDVLEKNREGK